MKRYLFRCIGYIIYLRITRVLAISYHYQRAKHILLVLRANRILTRFILVYITAYSLMHWLCRLYVYLLTYAAPMPLFMSNKRNTGSDT